MRALQTIQMNRLEQFRTHLPVHARSKFRAPRLYPYQFSCGFCGFAINKALLKLESISDIVDFCLKYVDSFNAVNVATACHRLAKNFRSSGSRLEMYRREENVHKALDALKVRALIKSSTFKPQEVANLMWALAALNCKPDAALTDAMLTRALFTMKGFAPQHLANLAWAIATLGIIPSTEFFEALSMRSVTVSCYFKPQEIANLLWSMATIGLNPGKELVNEISRQVMFCIDQFKSQEIANILWAMSTLEIIPGTQMIAAH